MRLLVLVKPVPDPEGGLALDEASGSLLPPAPDGYRLGRYDEIAIEAALRLKEAHPGASVALLTVGPEETAAAALRRGIGMGADQAILIAGRVTAAEAVAALIAERVRDGGFDLILGGVVSEDRMQGMVVPMVAARLDWPCATAAVALALEPQTLRLDVEREIEAGGREMVRLELPAAVTLQSGLYRPRYPTLSGLLRANRLALERIPAPPAAAEPPERYARPARARAGRMLSGSREEKAAALVQILRQKALLTAGRKR